MNTTKMVVGPRMARRIELKYGSKLRLDIGALPNGGFLLRIVATVPKEVSGRRMFIEVVIDRRECDNELELWASVATFASERLCDLADATEMGQGGC